MVLEKWAKEVEHYKLAEGFSLQKADNREFAKNYSIYLNVDIGFKSNYEQKCAVVASDDFCYWIEKDQIRIAGAFLQPNSISGVFMIPPFQDIYKVLKLLKEVLYSWSDKSKEIRAEVIVPEQVDYFQRLGFNVAETGRWMIRPTEKYEIVWNEQYEIKPPKIEDAEIIGEMFFKAFKKDVGNGKYNLEQRISFVRSYFENNSGNELLIRASTIIFDKNTSELVGACLVSEFREWPLISDIAVKSSYRGRGLATTMLKKAITIANEQYPAIRLYVQCGNAAESIYFNSGFLPGVKLTDLYISMEEL